MRECNLCHRTISADDVHYPWGAGFLCTHCAETRQPTSAKRTEVSSAWATWAEEVARGGDPEYVFRDQPPGVPMDNPEEYGG